MKNKIVTILVFLEVSLGGFTQELNLQGPDLMAEEQFARARDWYQERLKSPTSDPYQLIRLGDAYLALNSPDSAKSMYQKALNKDLKNPFAWAGLGKVALLDNDLRSQVDYFDRARRADKLNPVIYCYIAEGCTRLAKQDTATAKSYIELGLGIDPKFARLHLNAGFLAEMQKKWGEAVNAYGRAVFFDPKYALAYRRLGIAHMQLRNYPEALAAFQKSVAINPAQILVYRELGNLCYAMASYQEAETAYKTFLSRSGPSDDEKERLAIVLYYNKKFAEAAAMAEQLPGASRNDAVALRLKGYIACETGEYAKGMEYMDALFAMQKEDQLLATDFTCYARLLQKTGRDSLAAASLKKAVQLDPAKTEVYNELAQLASRENRHAEAAEWYKKMGEHGGDRLVTSFYAGKEYYFEGMDLKNRFDSLKTLAKKQKQPFPDSTSMRIAMQQNFRQADSSFTVVTRLNGDYAGGFLWKGRLQSLLDPETLTKGAREAYEKALALLEKGDPEANKKMMIECCRYLGYYHFMDYERQYRSNPAQAAEARKKSIAYFNRILSLDPADKQANQVISRMSKP